MGAIAKVRGLVGTGLVRVGLALLGYRPRGASEEPTAPEEEDNGGLPANVPYVVLSDAAKEMIVDGSPTWTAPRVEDDAPLRGSVAERLRTARREMGR